MRVIETDVLIAVRRQRMLDMLEGRIKMPRNLDMRDWDCGTTACAVGNYCMLPETEGLWLTNLGHRRVPTDGSLYEESMTSLMDPVAKHFAIRIEGALDCFGSKRSTAALIATKFRAACLISTKETA